MRFTALTTVVSLAALVAAQTTTSASSQSTVATMTTTSLSPQQTCLAACPSGDVCCAAKCVGVPCPNESAANDTTSCAAACVQGNGTEEETAQYAACQSRCISSYFLTYTATTTGANGAAETNSAGETTGTGSRTPSSTGTQPTPTGGATELRFGFSGVALVGLFITGLLL